MATDADLADPLRVLDPDGWLGGAIRGLRVLCLGSGGGLQSALCAAAGACVTVVDLSEGMLSQDREVAARRGLQVRTVSASIDDLSALGDGQFEVVLQPVCTAYVPDVRPVYREVARVMAPEGVYISQHKQPVSLQAESFPDTAGAYRIAEACGRSVPLPRAPEGVRHREAGTLEFVHRLESLLGEMCRAGFVIEDLVEPSQGDASARPGTWEHRCAYVPPYVRVKARRRGELRGGRLVVSSR